MNFTCPSLGVRERVPLIILFADGTIQLWTDTSLTLLDRWCCLFETRIEGLATSLFVSGDQVYVSDTNGSVHVLAITADGFKLVDVIQSCSEELISQLACGGQSLIMFHGRGKLSRMELKKKKMFTLIDDGFMGPLYLESHAGSVIAAKYNRLYQINGDCRCIEEGSEADGFAGVAVDKANGKVWLLGLSGAIYSVKLPLSEGHQFNLETKNPPGHRYLAVQMSSSGGTLVALANDSHGHSKLFAVSTGAPNQELIKDECAVWEACRQNALHSPFSTFRAKLASSDKEKRKEGFQMAVMNAPKDSLAINPGIKSFQQYLRTPTNKFAAIKGFSPEPCPDCKKAQVLFESFTEAKCSLGHAFYRSGQDFKCLSTLDPYQVCENCDQRYRLDSLDRCLYCQGKLHLVP